MNRYFWPDMPAVKSAPESKRPVKKARPYQARRVSIAAKNRREVFLNEVWKAYAEKSLLAESSRFGIKLLAYAFLPARLELLAENPPDVRVFDRMLKFFMQDTEFEYKLRERKRLWMGNYFTQGVTVDDSLEEAVAEMQKLGAIILAVAKAEAPT
ncbi:MAG: hypothetical protein L0Z48_00840 [candidate division Zixibacteria bacterium]|nr:hypothetical protein [candidate division Zixibacteria bacterium]MCI0595069.1 hypothetical protein [candidate division Zixibacteria bacterium]